MPDDENAQVDDSVDASEQKKQVTENSSEKGGSFLSKLKNNRSKRASAKRSARLDLFCFILILVFASYFKASNYKGQKTALLYYYEEATIIDTRSVETEDGKRQRVTISYDIGGQPTRKCLYFKKDPALIEGDVITLKIQTINPNNIEIEDM